MSYVWFLVRFVCGYLNLPQEVVSLHTRIRGTMLDDHTLVGIKPL